jgi:hypothetical protein
MLLTYACEMQYLNKYEKSNIFTGARDVLYNNTFLGRDKALMLYIYGETTIRVNRVMYRKLRSSVISRRGDHGIKINPPTFNTNALCNTQTPN